MENILMLNKTYLERKDRFFIPDECKGTELLSSTYALHFNENLQSLGYVLSPSAMSALLSCSVKSIGDLYSLIVDELKRKIGANVKHKPMYKNFPASVREKSDDELLHDQLFGYVADFFSILVDEDVREKIQFDGPVKERVTLSDGIEYKVINLGTEEECRTIFTNLMAGNKPLTEQDKDDLMWYLRGFEGAENSIPEKIPFKETLSFVVRIAIDMGFPIDKLPLKTAVDVLRVAVALSNGDVTLAKPTKFKHFSRKERTLLFSALEKIDTRYLLEDILRYEEPFKRLAEGTSLTREQRYKNRYPHLVAAMKRIQYGDKVQTYQGRLAHAYDAKDVEKEVALLLRRPGEFARALDKVLRDSKETETAMVLDSFRSVVDQVPTKTLWTLYTHFLYRTDNEGKERIVFPKGNPTEAKVIDPLSTSLSRELCNEVCLIIAEGILKQYANREPMGKVYISDELKRYAMPFAARSSNKNSMMLTRGTRLPLKEKLETLRLFVYWKGRDVDLSSFMMTEDFEYITHISYTNLWNRDRKGDMIAVHSGDITNAPHGASEFIDINVAALQKCYPTARYVAMNVYSFSQIPFKDIEVCFAGVMEREDADSGEIFEPATVKIKSDIDGNSVNTLPLLVDLKTREVIWVDLKSDSYGFNIEMTRKGIVMASKAIATSKIPTVYDVLLANVHARGGEYVDTPVDENGLLLNDVTIFAVDQGIRPMDTDVLVADYL